MTTFRFIRAFDFAVGNPNECSVSFHRTAIFVWCHITSGHKTLFRCRFVASNTSVSANSVANWSCNWPIVTHWTSRSALISYIKICSVIVNHGLSVQVELVSIEIGMPKSVLNVNLNASQGKCSFDSVSKQMNWDVGRIECNKSPTLKGSITLQSGQPLPDSNPTILIKFMLNQMAASGLKVNRLDLYGEVSLMCHSIKSYI